MTVVEVKRVMNFKSVKLQSNKRIKGRRKNGMSICYLLE
jgi:hypothetical protein